ncbi:hypothetical protein ACWEQL_08220 [Kitasatospora sp. NPDC004240]
MRFHHVLATAVAAVTLTAGSVALTTGTAHAKTTFLRTTHNLAGVEYISETDTFRLWDNAPDDTLMARVEWKKVNSSTVRGTLWHRWENGTNGRSSNQNPNTGMKSGDQFTFRVCAVDRGQVKECSSWGTAWY